MSLKDVPLKELPEVRPYTKRGKAITTKKKKKPRMYIHSKTRKKPLPRYRSTRDYDFLQYIRVVMKWATENTGLTKPQIELILYLYPLGTFTRYEFYAYHKLMGLYQKVTFDKWIEDGWMYEWRKRSNKSAALYALTNKAKTVCSKMHQFCVGDKDVPISSRSNVLVNSDVRINGYYMDFIKKMNKEREDKQKETDE